MKTTSSLLFVFAFLLGSCNPFSAAFPGPRNIDWKKEWGKNQYRLKALTADILAEGSKKYKTGINDFPKEFEYPFDDGYFIRKDFDTTGVDTINTKKITILFYVDRGLLDHYSAFIFSNDSTAIREFERNVKNGGNDFKIESNWYMIND